MYIVIIYQQMYSMYIYIFAFSCGSYSTFDWMNNHMANKPNQTRWWFQPQLKRICVSAHGAKSSLQVMIKQMQTKHYYSTKLTFNPYPPSARKSPYKPSLLKKGWLNFSHHGQQLFIHLYPSDLMVVRLAASRQTRHFFCENWGDREFE